MKFVFSPDVILWLTGPKAPTNLLISYCLIYGVNLSCPLWDSPCYTFVCGGCRSDFRFCLTIRLIAHQLWSECSLSTYIVLLFVPLCVPGLAIRLPSHPDAFLHLRHHRNAGRCSFREDMVTTKMYTSQCETYAQDKKEKK